MPDARTLQAAVTFDSTADQHYYVQIGGFPTSSDGTFQFGRLQIAVR